MQDCSERFKQFGEALNTSSLLSATDTDGVITYVNKNFCDLTGHSEKELLGSRHKVISSGIHPPEFWARMWTEISAGGTWRGEVLNRNKNGSFFWLDTFIYPVLNSHGDIIEYLSLRNDITLRKHQEDEIVRQNNLLTRIARLQSHEVRRPVSSILGLIQLFEQEDESMRDNLELITHLKRMGQELDEKIKEIVRLTEDIHLVVSGSNTSNLNSNISL